MSFRSMKLELMGFVPELDAVQTGLRINAAYKYLWYRRMWSYRTGQGYVTTVAPYTTGTVDATVGSDTLVGTDTTWTTLMEGRFICIDGGLNYYEISTVTPPDTIVLTTNFGDSAGSLTGANYIIFQHQYALPSDCETINSVIYNQRILAKPIEFLDAMDPNRRSTGDDPAYYAKLNNNTIELWPVPSSAYTFRVHYVKEFTPLTTEASVPLIDENLIMAYARLNAYLQLASSPELGAHYLQVSQMAQTLYQDAYRVAEETDQSRMSLPTRVLVEGYETPWNDDFLTYIDPYDPRGG